MAKALYRVHTAHLYWEGSRRIPPSTKKEFLRQRGNDDLRPDYIWKWLQKMTLVAGHLLDAGPVSDWTPELQNLLGFRLKASVDPSQVSA